MKRKFVWLIVLQYLMITFGFLVGIIGVFILYDLYILPSFAGAFFWVHTTIYTQLTILCLGVFLGTLFFTKKKEQIYDFYTVIKATFIMLGITSFILGVWNPFLLQKLWVWIFLGTFAGTIFGFLISVFFLSFFAKKLRTNTLILNIQNSKPFINIHNRIFREFFLYQTNDTSNLPKKLEKHSIDEVIVPRSTDPKELSMLKELSIQYFFRLLIWEDQQQKTRNTFYIQVNDIPIMVHNFTPLTEQSRIFKFVFEYILALIGVVIFSPIFAFVAFLVWVENRKAPILYIAPRVGRFGKLFPCFKFRTMIPDAESQKKYLLDKNIRKDGIYTKIKNDPRITKLGKFLRKYSIDELPQIFNILRGEMGLIGPRPHLPEEIAKYDLSEIIVLHIKPGITGYAQVQDKPGTMDAHKELSLEKKYVEKWSFWLDITIFLKTFLVILTGRNH